jgi:hypothetical protein
MDNFNLRKYLTEGKLLKEEYTYNEFIKDNFPRINVKKEEIGIKPALKALGVESGDEIEELTNTMDSTNTALYLTNAKENGYLKELPIRSEYFEKAYLGKWKNGETIVVFSDGWDEFVYIRKSLAEDIQLSEDVGLIANIALGVAGGLAGLYAVVKGAKWVKNELGYAAYLIARNMEGKAREASLQKYEDEIKSIIVKFDGDSQLASMYEALPEEKGAERTKQLKTIADYIKSKLSEEELEYFTDISSMLRTGGLADNPRITRRSDGSIV